MSTYTNHRKKEVDIHGISAYFKRLREMAELKWVFTVLQIGGLTAYIWALFISFANVDVVTRTLLSSLGALFVFVKLIDFIATRIRKHHLETIEIRSKLNNEKERELAIREREIFAYDQETEIIKSYNGK